jgi:hypothetical protein
MREPDHRHVRQSQPLRRQEPAVAGDHRAVVGDQDRLRPAVMRSSA